MCMTNKKYLFFFVLFLLKGLPRCSNWTLDFAPAFLQWFYSPLSPRSIFHTAQRFLLPNHVTSGCMSPRSLFPPDQRFPKPRDFRSPRSFFPTAQRFSFPKHVTSGCMSPRSFFPTGQRFPPPKNT